MAVPSDDDRPPQAVERPSDSGRLHGADAVRLHLTLAAGLALCTAAFVFEVLRALGGNTLSWAYVFEWPIFAAFALYMWWNLLHGQDGAGRRRGAGTGQGRDPATATTPDTPPAAAPGGAGGNGGEGSADGDDAGLAAWQDYLRGMEAEEARQSQSDERGES